MGVFLNSFLFYSSSPVKTCLRSTNKRTRSTRRMKQTRNERTLGRRHLFGLNWQGLCDVSVCQSICSQKEPDKPKQRRRNTLADGLYWFHCSFQWCRAACGYYEIYKMSVYIGNIKTLENTGTTLILLPSGQLTKRYKIMLSCTKTKNINRLYYTRSSE